MNTDFWKGKKVFLTGHTGFKGSWLSLWLNRLDAKVTGYALSAPTRPSMFELVHINENVVSIIADINNYEKLLSCIKESRPEIVIHMAAQSLVRISYQEPVRTYQTNVMGTVNLFEAVRQIGTVKVLLNITSDKCYANQERSQPYGEKEALGGRDPYSSSKACSELVTAAYRDSFFPLDDYHRDGVAVASARAGNVIGGGDWAKDRLIPDCIRAWLNQEVVKVRYPDSVRPWQHVLEPLSGYLLLVEKLYEGGPQFSGPWNFGPDANDAKNVRDLITILAELWEEDTMWEVDKAYHPHEAGLLKLDCTKASTELKWQPRWNLDTALRKTIDWYLTYRDEPERLKNKTIEQLNEYMKALTC